jgi:hypothetical protein
MKDVQRPSPRSGNPRHPDVAVFPVRDLNETGLGDDQGTGDSARQCGAGAECQAPATAITKSTSPKTLETASREG